MAACTLAPPTARPLRARRTARGLTCVGSATFGAQDTPGAHDARPAAQPTAAGCPFFASRAAQNPLPQGAPWQAGIEGAGAVAPGPRSAAERLVDLAFLATRGIEAATLRFALKYGDVCRFENSLRLGGAAGWTFVASPAGIEHCCATRAANYASRFLPDAYAYATGGLGVLGSQGAYNRAQRRLCGAPFLAGGASAAAFADAAGAAASRLADAWDAAASGAPDGVTADVADHAQRLTLDVIGRVAFSHDFQQVARLKTDASRAPDALLRHINDAQAAMGALFVTPMPLLRALSALRAPPMAQLDAALAGMRAEVAPVIASRRAQLAAQQALAAQQQEQDSQQPRHRDLLDALLAAGLSDEEVWEDVHDVLGAGHETTATTLAGALHALAAQPALAAELDAQLAQLGGRTPTAADVASGKLWYAAALIKESLRLYPPIPLFPRVAAAEDTLPDGTRVPAGEVVFMSAYAMGRLPSLWSAPGAAHPEDDVFRFDPLRFTPEAEAARHRFSFVPFGAGPRMCLGASFALTSATLMLATLAQRVSFSLPSGGGAAARGKHAQSLLHAAYDITLHFPRGVPLRVAPRRP